MSASRSGRLARGAALGFFCCTALASCISIGLPGGSTSSAEARRTVERRSMVDPAGRRLSFLRAGVHGAPRVIYVHGTPGDAASWMDFLTSPVEDMESFAVDRPGFGRSMRTGAVPSLREQAAALEPLLSVKHGEKPILVGHSLGAPIIARTAADFPDRVGSLVIVSGSMDPSLEKVLWIQHAARAPLLRGIVPEVLENTNEELLPLEGELRALQPLLRELRCPVYVIHGDKDGLVPYANVAYLRETIPEGRLVHVETLRGGNHFVPWNNAESIREGVRFLRGLPGD